jgi:hypothetical protein
MKRLLSAGYPLILLVTGFEGSILVTREASFVWEWSDWFLVSGF